MNISAKPNAPRLSPFSGLPFDPWPAVLPRTHDDPILPFAIGIVDDLLLRLPEPHWPAAREALRKHCGSRPYLQALASEGAWRCDVDGNPIAQVSDIGRLVAAIKLLELAIRKTGAHVKAEAAPLVAQAKIYARVSAKAPTESPGPRPSISLKRA
jgi:sRNA-binding protein